MHESCREKHTPESVLKKLDMLETARQAVIAALDASVVRQSTIGDVSAEL
ncbi:TPA: hypothetical protein R3975_003309 [Salmonella enterica subsp. enterica serovar Muenchen]|nr:hypothetical protein [Salmonella enterica subsp. enterica serovar Chester]HEC7513851.1 hypothetical protein [Salmonella enterica subsp. enterica serovar Muenchen]EHZ1826453.1 hypothetical protein [Salmonella enterica subsp. enterica serovar Chester]HEC7519797.1 hypothetical protein [Salmonella enterica subsp. enterica serovar Muenchen]HEC7579268.1 hypothetical protein [Salmonella enterica subsp. enterica serovar Muenchen]